MSSLRILKNNDWTDAATVQDSNSSSCTDALLKMSAPSLQANTSSFSLESVFSEHLSKKMNTVLSPSHGCDYSPHDRFSEKLFPLSPLTATHYHHHSNKRNTKNPGLYKRSSYSRHHHHHPHSRLCFGKRPSRIPILSARLLINDLNKKKGKKTAPQSQATLIRALERIHISSPRTKNGPPINTTYINSLGGTSPTSVTKQSRPDEKMNGDIYGNTEESLAQYLSRMAIQ